MEFEIYNIWGLPAGKPLPHRKSSPTYPQEGSSCHIDYSTSPIEKQQQIDQQIEHMEELRQLLTHNPSEYIFKMVCITGLNFYSNETAFLKQQQSFLEKSIKNKQKLREVFSSSPA